MISRSSHLFFLGFFLFSLVLTALPSPATAASLIPCGRTGADATAAERAPCTICHIILGGWRIIDWGLKVMTYAAIAVIVAMAIFYIVSTGNEGMMTIAKGGITASLVGFAVMLGAWLIINTTLRIMVIDERDGKPLAGLRQNGAFSFTCDTSSSAGTAQGPGAPSTGRGTAPGGGVVTGGGAVCTDPAVFKTSLTSGGKVCDGIPCGKQKCIFAPQVESAITGNSGAFDSRFIKALVCQESNGNAIAINPTGSSPSCGLMQVNVNEVSDNTSCTGPAKNLFDPVTNIQEGVRVFQRKMGQVNPASFGNLMTQEQMALAAYNCCDNGDNPNAQSVSCSPNPPDSWPNITKWACPIAPGSGVSNMCTVKSYACSITACVSQY
ncbi:MAG: lytic transglycosylase domain-containing protein [bacterium]|nr:lytic transglycosylase domain-containing protein [bacterium]